MRRLLIALSVVSTLSVFGTAAASLQGPTPDPVGIGGGVEVPEAGFSLTIPADWLWIDASSGDIKALAALAEATDPERAMSLTPVMTHWPAEIPLPDLFAMAPLGPENGMESCSVTASPSTGDSPDERMATDAAATAAEPEWSVTDTLLVDLPTGPAGRLDLVTTFTSTTVDLDIPSSRYYLTGERREYLLNCFAPDPPADRWRSIAETFEFLPDEE